jgi:hypothetical protein
VAPFTFIETAGILLPPVVARKLSRPANLASAKLQFHHRPRGASSDTNVLKKIPVGAFVASHLKPLGKLPRI